MNTWSHSRLQCYGKCPCQYDLKYLQEIPQEIVPGFEFGSQVHQQIERYTLFCYREGVSRDHNKARLMAAAIDDKRLARIVEQFADRLTFRVDLVYAEEDSVERWLEVDLPNGDIFNGKIDLVEFDPVVERWIITDYKSSYAPKWTTRAPRQLLLYATAWRQVVDQPAAKFRVQQAYPCTDLQPQEWYPEEKDLGWDWVLELIGEIKAAKRFPTTPGPHCEYCPYLLTACPYATERSVVCTRLKTEQDRLEALKYLQWLQEAVKRQREVLQKDCRERGPIEMADGTAWGWHTEFDNEYKIPARRGSANPDVKIVDAAARAGLTISELIEHKHLRIDKSLARWVTEKLAAAGTEGEIWVEDKEFVIAQAIAKQLEQRAAKPSFGRIPEGDDDE